MRHNGLCYVSRPSYKPAIGSNVKLEERKKKLLERMDVNPAEVQDWWKKNAETERGGKGGTERHIWKAPHSKIRVMVEIGCKKCIKEEKGDKEAVGAK